MSDLIFDNLPQKYKGIIEACNIFKKTLGVVHTWYKQNIEIIQRYIEMYADLSTWHLAVKKMIENHIIFTEDLPSKLAKKILDSNDVATVIQEYYFENQEQQMNKLIYRCRQSIQMVNYSVLFEQILKAYQLGHYHLACIGLFSVVDGVLADISKINKSGFKVRIKAVEDKIKNKISLDNLDKRCLCIYSSIGSFDTSIFKDSYFVDTEPDYINRHWTLHGRTRRSFSQYDFLLVLLWLDALIFIDKICLEHDKSEGDNV